MDRLILGLILFLGFHSISIVAESRRDRIVTRIGDGPWKSLYSLASIAAFFLIVTGYGLARQESVLVYTSPQWLRTAGILLMLPVFPLILTVYLPGRIRNIVEHPILVASQLWAIAHLCANGLLADIVLFGSFLTWAVIDRLSMRRRVARPIPRAPTSGVNDIIAVVVGLGIYLVFVMWLHVRLFGVPIV